MSFNYERMKQVVYEPLNLKHLNGLADLHYLISTDHSLLPLMGRRAITAFYRWWADNPQVVALVASCNGTVIGHALGPLSPASYRHDLHRDLGPQLFAGLARAAVRHPIHFAQLIYPRLDTLRAAMRSVLCFGHGSGPEEANVGITYATLLSIGLDPKYQGSGVAKELLGHFVEEMGRRGVIEVRLSVRNTNLRARSFYTKCGWRVVGKSDAGSLRYQYLLNNVAQ